MKCLPFALTLFAVLAAVSPCRADGELRALQDSVVRWLAAHPDDLLAEAFTTAWSDEADGCVEVHLLRADSAMKARFRRCVHDSRRIRLAGFDPCTVPYPSAPEGGTAPAALFSMHAEYALYPCDADTVRLTIRNAGRQRLCFGTDYAVCRLHGDRWERLPDGRHAALPADLSRTGERHRRTPFHGPSAPAPLSGRIRPLPHLQTGLHRTPPPRLSVDGRVHRHALRPLHPFRPIGVCGADFAPSRRKFPIVITLYVLAFIIASLLYRRRHRHIDMRTVRRLELERYMGRWYEIARYDRPFERRLRNIEARYTLRADGNVEMERAGIDIRTGRRHTSCRHARRTQRSGRLRVKNFIFLHTDYCILELDDQYQWALVGSTAPLRLQILSRQPRIRRDTLRHIVGLAERRGYPLDRLRLLRAPQ